MSIGCIVPSYYIYKKEDKTKVIGDAVGHLNSKIRCSVRCVMYCFIAALPT